MYSVFSTRHNTSQITARNGAKTFTKLLRLHFTYLPSHHIEIIIDTCILVFISIFDKTLYSTKLKYNKLLNQIQYEITFKKKEQSDFDCWVD